MEKYSEIPLKQLERTIPMDEIEAAGYLFGADNLAILDGTVTGILKKYGKNWKKIVSYIKGTLQNSVESDEMYDDMIEEVKDWIKNMKSDPTTQKMWEEEKQKAGLTDKVSVDLEKERKNIEDLTKSIEEQNKVLEKQKELKEEKK